MAWSSSQLGALLAKNKELEGEAVVGAPALSCHNCEIGNKLITVSLMSVKSINNEQIGHL